MEHRSEWKCSADYYALGDNSHREIWGYFVEEFDVITELWGPWDCRAEVQLRDGKVIRANYCSKSAWHQYPIAKAMKLSFEEAKAWCETMVRMEDLP